MPCTCPDSPPERAEPYILNVEIARAKLMQIVNKREDWWVFNNIGGLADISKQAQDLFIQAIRDISNVPLASKLADESLQKAIVFSEEGKYRVMLFMKKEATSDASIGTIDEDGMAYMQDTYLASDRYTLVRVVFKDGVFTHFRVWGSVHQSSVSGLQRIR